MLERYADYVDTWMRLCISASRFEHKMVEDFIGWGLEGSRETMVNTYVGSGSHPRRRPRRPASSACVVRAGAVSGAPDPRHRGCDHPDRVEPRRSLRSFGWDLVEMEGNGQVPAEPVRLNLLVRDFVDRVLPPPARPRTWTRALSRPKRALYLSSPIGLGHARRDLAIADELRKLQPDLEIEWLTQHPVTRCSSRVASASIPRRRIWPTSPRTSKASRPSTTCTRSRPARRWTRSSCTTSASSTTCSPASRYDSWIGDEAWDVDFFLHENPELKRTSFVWMTDFVGMLPMPDGGEREAFLTAEYNAEMIEQVARFRRVRDRSIFVGDPDDLVPDRSARTCPASASGPRQNFDFAGYVTGFDPVDVADRAALRASFG